MEAKEIDEAAGPRSPAALRQSFKKLMTQRDLEPTHLGRELGYRSKDPGAMVRRFLEGKKDLTLGRTAALAELCGARLRPVPRRADPWAAAIEAIEELGEMRPEMRGDLIDLIERERERRKATPQKARAIV